MDLAEFESSRAWGLVENRDRVMELRTSCS